MRFTPSLTVLAGVPGLFMPVRPLSAQTVDVYVEAGGSAVYGGSLNVEVPFSPSLALRGGISPFGAIPLLIRYMTPWPGHRTEVSAGVLLAATFTEPELPETSGPGALPTAALGYRYQEEGGWLFRATITPVLSFTPTELTLWAGVSLGLAL